MYKVSDRKIYLTLLISMTLTFLLFILSLTQNAYYTYDGQENVGSIGLIILLLGLFGITKGAGLVWVANPCLIMSIIHLRRENLRKAKIFSFISVLLGFSFMLFDNVVADEGGNTTEIKSYGLGYWLWLSSLIINLLGILITERLIKTTANSRLAQWLVFFELNFFLHENILS